MSHDPNYVRQQAQEDVRREPLSPKANEQMIPDAVTRDIYNAEVERQREQQR